MCLRVRVWLRFGDSLDELWDCVEALASLTVGIGAGKQGDLVD